MKKLVILQIKGYELGGVWYFNKSISEELLKHDFEIEIISIRNNLVKDNISLKQEIRNLKNKIDVLVESDGSGNVSNADVLRRISKLEKIIYGKE